MHEMAMVRSVVDIVLEEAEHAGATEVLGVYLTVGYSRDIVEDVFESMFAWMCRGTVAEGAVLHLTRVPFTVRCEECGRIFPVNTRCRDTSGLRPAGALCLAAYSISLSSRDTAQFGFCSKLLRYGH